MFKIEKDVPIPNQNRSNAGRKPKYPLRELEVGDSFFLSGKTQALYRNVTSCMSVMGKATGRKFSIRSFEDGFRVWRIA